MEGIVVNMDAGARGGAGRIDTFVSSIGNKEKRAFGLTVAPGLRYNRIKWRECKVGDSARSGVQR